MTAWLPAQRRAEAFEAALESGTEGADPRFTDLLELVETMRESAELTIVEPRSDFSVDLRARLMAAADTELVPTDPKLLLPQRTSTTRTRRQGRISAAAAALAVVAGTAGIAAASGSALPGESLYPFKRGVETAHSSLAFNDAARGRDRLDQADARLAEITDLVRGQGDRSQLPATIAAFDEQAGSGADLIFRDFQSGGDVDSVTDVRSFAGAAMLRIGDLTDRVPASLRPALAESASLLADLDQQASVICGSCGARDTLQAPDDLELASATDPLVTLLNVEPLAAEAAKAAEAAQAPSVKPDKTPAPDSGAGTGTGGATAGVGGTVGGVVGGVVGGITGGGTGGSGGSTGSTGGGAGGVGAVVRDPIGSILGTLNLPLPTADPNSGNLVDGVGKAVGGLLGGTTTK